ncbi:uncharacterized protein LOC110435849 [Sorghum bicolor]|uniref:uncharacterized protein LOC110435849 n=1 Tax=Sorghum bicolor TaxID=4558 RepID=UPI000B4265ED|nr:uncharacterized protein LOC110435849 [Sorghum bicolor]|eukprot:XP_021317599.1 uncharacterized protein LOC110435849 [Sorghum bicolor]
MECLHLQNKMIEEFTRWHLAPNGPTCPENRSTERMVRSTDEADESSKPDGDRGRGQHTIFVLLETTMIGLLLLAIENWKRTTKHVGARSKEDIQAGHAFLYAVSPTTKKSKRWTFFWCSNSFVRLPPRHLRTRPTAHIIGNIYSFSSSRPARHSFLLLAFISLLSIHAAARAPRTPVAAPPPRARCSRGRAGARSSLSPVAERAAAPVPAPFDLRWPSDRAASTRTLVALLSISGCRATALRAPARTLVAVLPARTPACPLVGPRRAARAPRTPVAARPLLERLRRCLLPVPRTPVATATRCDPPVAAPSVSAAEVACHPGGFRRRNIPVAQATRRPTSIGAAMSSGVCMPEVGACIYLLIYVSDRVSGLQIFGKKF